MNEQIEELFAVYALGGLTEAEQHEVEAYVAQNPSARLRLDEMIKTAVSLSYAAPPLSPSPEREQELMDRVERSAAARRATMPRPVTNGVVKRPFWWQQLRAFLTPPLFATFSTAMALIIFLWALFLLRQVATLQRQLLAATTENSSLQTNLDTLTQEKERLDTQIAALTRDKETLLAENTQLQTANGLLREDNARLSGAREVQALLNSPNIHTISLPGTEEQPEASGQLVIDRENHVAILIVNGMPELPQGQVYQVLLIRGTEHETAETFRVDTQGQGVLLVHSAQPINSFDAVGVSVEPAGGSPQRTGEVILLGSLTN